MRKVLITAFEPFGTARINPSEEALKLIKEEIEGVEIHKLVLPVIFDGAFESVEREIKRLNPEAVICLGLAGGRRGITLERVAINIDDARIPDNNGAQPIDEPIIKEGKSAYFSTLPIKAMAEEIKGFGVEAGISNSAGTYVCNNIMYRLLHYIAVNDLETKGGFIHIPYATEFISNEKTEKNSISIEKIVLSLEKVIKVAVKYSEDIKIAGGKLH